MAPPTTRTRGVPLPTRAGSTSTSTSATAGQGRKRRQPVQELGSGDESDDDLLSGSFPAASNALVGSNGKATSTPKPSVTSAQVDEIVDNAEEDDEDDDQIQLDDGSSNGDLSDFVYASGSDLNESENEQGGPILSRAQRRKALKQSAQEDPSDGDVSGSDEQEVDSEYDSQANSDSDDEGYNSSDIERMEREGSGSSPGSSIHPPSRPSSFSSSKNSNSLKSATKHLPPFRPVGDAYPFPSRSTSSNPTASASADSPDNAALDALIRLHTTRPDESISYDGSTMISTAKRGEGVLVDSRFVKGGKRRVYEGVEAGYGSESSTEENSNAIGNIPIEWYDDMPHIGYSVDGKKVMRPAKGDELDRFLATVEDPDSWTTAEDKLLQKDVRLSDKELDIIRRLQNGENPDAGFNPYQPTVEWFTGKGQEMVMPLSAQPEPKRRFVPSVWEHKKIMKIVKAIREGRIVPNRPAAEKPKVYTIWSNTDQENAPHAMYMPAPQLPPPKTIESYNPPEEYLFDKGEKAEWEGQDKEDRKTDFMPQRHSTLRGVPGYDNFIQERFERCLDLYLAPRVRKIRLNIDPESLIPKLPSPKELRPFPTTCAVQYRHPANSRVRCVSVAPKGEWVASGSEDGLVRVWDLGNGREVWRWKLGAGAVQAIEWNPNAEECMLTATVSGRVYVLAPLALVSPAVAKTTLEHINNGFSYSAASANAAAAAATAPKAQEAKWTRPSEEERDRGVMVIVEVPGVPKQVTWHRKGDYFATVASDAGSKSVLIHQLTKHQTQAPFKKTKGNVQKVAFHPTKPHFFVATQRYVKLYDLVGQKLLKSLLSGLKWISSMDIHPLGDNLIVGSYDKKLCWFDLDLSTKPYKTLRYHAKALRAVAYHRSYPLFASASDDGSIHIFHGMVYSDLMQNPLIVPLKVLKGHAIKDGLGVLDLRWHPTKPWLISSGADGEVRMWAS